MSTQTVINADCLEYMKTLPDKSFDLCLTDPPYGVSFRATDWDDEIPDWIHEGRRVAKSVIVITGTLTIWEYPHPTWVLNWYRPASSSRSKLGGFSHWSPILVYGDLKFPVDSINLHAIQHAMPSGFEHPTPKPVELMRWLVRFGAPKETDTILDPFMGSGTTLVAAKYLNRNATGIEISEKYCEIARNRLSQQQLF